MHDFIMDEQRAWDISKLKDVFDDDSVYDIVKIPIPYVPANNSYIWVNEAKGKFMVKSAYRTSQEDKWAGPVSATWKRIWRV